MGPLTGLKVVEVAGLAPAPFACMILADLGAEVLRIDRAAVGAAYVAPAGPLDRGRRTLGLDLKSPEGVEVLRSVTESADVFVEGFRPGVAERLGFGPEELLEQNPRLVYGRMTGWGQDGPLAPSAGHDINYIALSGALEPIGRAGERPHAPLNLLGDFAGGGMLLVVGILAALHERATSGRGEVVDAAMADGASLLMTFIHGMRAAGMWDGERGTNFLDGGAPFYDTYECADGRYVAVGCVEPPFYQRFLKVLGVDEESEGLDFQLDPRGWERTRTVVAARFKERSRDQWAKDFEGTDACVTPVLSPWEAHEHVHHRERRSFVEVDGLVQPAPAPRFSRSAVAEPGPIDAGGRDPLRTLLDWGIPESQANTWVADRVR
ncbi:CaiB/BaiF CoA transferase family protein [Nocardioides sp. LML1-1-1.1]|uniref:CaiB/BaiF CoA transferase family protein n=1 Tax=Nocardioides sp. LML1-1-1.1 TaxID=3135248 RepID=UPI00342B456F